MPVTPSGETYFWIEGRGSPLVLVHGLGMQGGMWRPLLPALAEHHRVITYDVAGHGRSRSPADPVTLGALSEQLLRLLDDLSLARAALVGFSLGGMIVRRFAIDHPGRTNLLVVLSSAHDRTVAEREAVRKRVEQAKESGPEATIDAAIGRWFTPGFRAVRPAAVAEVRAAILANDRSVYPKLYRVLAEGDLEIAAAIAGLSMPLLAMTCADDPGNTPEMSRRMAALVPGAEVRIVPGLRHMGLWERPEIFTDAILDFLARRLPVDRPDDEGYQR
jgi:pimeloyl-ACP methyl ester carboxylesterase